MSDWRTELTSRLPVLDPRARTATPKPDRFARKAEKKRDRREHAQLRDKHRTRIFVLDSGKCRCHGRKVYLKVADAPHEFAVGHVHEWIPKSLGGDDLSDYNCILLCAEMHGPVTRHEVDIVAHCQVALMRGPVDFVPKDGKPLLDR